MVGIRKYDEKGSLYNNYTKYKVPRSNFARKEYDLYEEKHKTSFKSSLLKEDLHK